MTKMEWPIPSSSSKQPISRATSAGCKPTVASSQTINVGPRLEVVEQATDKRQAWETVVWALLNTAEFSLNH